MYVKDLLAAFAGDTHKVAAALGYKNPKEVFRVIRTNRLVPLLKAFRLTHDHPKLFPKPVDWQLYEREQDAAYRRRGRALKKR